LRKTIQFPNFDAELNTDICGPTANAELTLTLRLGLRKVDPFTGGAAGIYLDGDLEAREIIRWTPGVWEKWKSDFSSIVQPFWDGKFCLINDCFSFPFQIRGMTLYPNVWCRFNLILNDAPTSRYITNDEGASRNHYTIDVVRLDPNKANSFRSHSMVITSEDLKNDITGATKGRGLITQITALHEIGHLLGLNHVAVGKPGCPTSWTDAPACYGVSDYDKLSVMGQGMLLRPEHDAYPWREALRYFDREERMMRVTKVPLGEKFAALMTAIHSPLSPWPAQMWNSYPRTFLGVETGRELA